MFKQEIDLDKGALDPARGIAYQLELAACVLSRTTNSLLTGARSIESISKILLKSGH